MSVWIPLGIVKGFNSVAVGLYSFAMMNDPDQSDTYSDAETVARREAALRNMLTAPAKPHKAMRKGGKESSQGK